MRPPLLPLLSAALVAQAPLPLRSPEAVAEAERAFATLASRVGTPKAFLEVLTEEALVFTPRPRNGHEVQRSQPEDGSRLVWEPDHVELAASGDFAISTGPWSWRPKGAEQAAVHGHFLSLWGLREGRWRVLVDIGAPHPLQAARPLELRALAAPARPGGRAALTSAWKAFDAQAAEDLGKALATHGAADLRRYRPGKPLEPGAPGPATLPGVQWTEGGVQVAASEDLAVRWGLRTRRDTTASALQVWRREAGDWRLAMDVELPHPPAP